MSHPLLDQARRDRAAGRSGQALAGYVEYARVGRDVDAMCEAAGFAARIDPRVGERLARATLRLSADRPDAVHHLAEALARQGRYTEALPLFRAAVGADGRLADLSARGESASPWTVRSPRVACPGCEADQVVLVHVGNGTRAATTHGLIDPVKVWGRCTACGLVRVLEPPDPEAVEAYASRHRSEGGGEPPPEVDYLQARLLAAERLLVVVESLLGGAAPERAGSDPIELLEVGAGYGTLLAAATHRGFSAMGLELSRPAAMWAADRLGVHTRVGTIPWALPDELFSVVVLHDVLDHLPNPHTALRVAATRLKPGGVLVATLPSLDHPLHRLQGYDDPAWSTPDRLVYFDRATLGVALEGAGITLIDQRLSERGEGRVLYLGWKAAEGVGRGPAA